VLLPTGVIHALVLNAGIVGGFALPTLNATHSTTKESSSDDLVISSALRGEHQSGLESQPEQQKSAAEVSGLVDELHAILMDLPTEQPPGSEDIYGLDVAIALGSDNFMWWNGEQSGCGGGESLVQATEREKASFE
jgi:hypothetical protein